MQKSNYIYTELHKLKKEYGKKKYQERWKNTADDISVIIVWMLPLTIEFFSLDLRNYSSQCLGKWLLCLRIHVAEVSWTIMIHAKLFQILLIFTSWITTPWILKILKDFYWQTEVNYVFNRHKHWNNAVLIY